MTKRQLIDEIVTMNRSAPPSFLAKFNTGDLREYLDHLALARQPRLRTNAAQRGKYLQAVAAAAMSPQYQAEPQYMWDSYEEPTSHEPSPERPESVDREPAGLEVDLTPYELDNGVDFRADDSAEAPRGTFLSEPAAEEGSFESHEAPSPEAVEEPGQDQVEEPEDEQDEDNAAEMDEDAVDDSAEQPVMAFAASETDSAGVSAEEDTESWLF